MNREVKVVGRKKALVTGGATGIGKRIAIELAQQGMDLAINYRTNKQKAEELARELTEAFGTKNAAIPGDVADHRQCLHIVEKSRSAIGEIDVFIHNAGPYIHERKKMADYSVEEWQYMLEGNLSSGFYLSRLLIPHMRQQKWGRIISIGYDRVESAPGWLYRSAFAASKTGLASLTRTLALEEAENGITANMVCPGDIIAPWKESNIEDALEMEDQSVPVGRPGTGEDIARVVAFLIDDQSGYVTGSIIPVTGGKDVLGKVYRGEG